MRFIFLFAVLIIGMVLYGQEDSWTIEKRELPISETFEEGTKVVFVIPYESHTVVNYSNESEAPASTVHHVSENGTLLPDEKIGPVKYRTRQFDPGEKLRMVYNWENGYEITIEVHEGKIHLEIKPEGKIL